VTPRGTPGRSDHTPTYLGLLTKAALEPVEAAPDLDAVFVPASRGVREIEEAGLLVRSLGTRLVVLCSGNLCAAEAVDALESYAPGVRATAVDRSVDDGPAHLPLDCSDHPFAGTAEYADVAAKRNLAVLIARLAGWRRVLFLDDDIFGLAPALCRSASRTLLSRGWRALGLLVDHFPDNSVVCHAHRLAGGEQGTFIGSGALLVAVDSLTGFFPPVYNEDWLFLFDDVSRGLVGWTGSVAQKSFDPYRAAERADHEEFGDVLAEGLYNLLLTGRTIRTARRQPYWRAELGRRRAFLDRVHAGLERMQVAADGAAGVAVPATRSVETASTSLDRIDPDDLAGFVGSWRSDLARWQDSLAVAGPAGSLHAVLAHLDLKGVSTSG
jgi:hypothetical protein